MAGVTEQLRDWLARAEMLARGLEGIRRHAAFALDAGRPWDARSDALQILRELPRSAIALALWAEAAEAMMLDDEAVEALERLAHELPFRADVWLRLANVQRRLGRDVEDLLERAALSAEPPDAADAARLALLEWCLDRGKLARAEHWLEQLPPELRDRADTRRREAQILLESGELDRARALESSLPDPEAIDARGWLLRGRLLSEADPGRAAHAFARALLLDAPGSERSASRFVAGSADSALADGLAEIVKTLGLAERPLWRAAFAAQRGHPEDGLELLARAARAPAADAGAVLDYAERAGELRNAAALVEASRIARERSLALDPDSERLVAALDALDPRQRLPLLDSVGGRRAAWAHELRRDSYAAWLRPNLPANWRELLQETAALGEKLGDPGVMTPLTALAVDLERPLRVAVIGEFNAGKSTFVNALLGSAVVPTGVLPTTATVNHLVWGTERAAEIQLRSLEPNRTLAHAELGPALAAYDPACIAQVEIRAPLELLRRLEIIDTPGFNAPEAAHAAAARQAIGDAHVVVWLLDAAQPFKASERAIGSELARLELPLVVLINKLDRLGNDELPLVLDHVTQALQQLGLRLEAPPLPLSARSAVTGRSGDALRLAASNWRAVEQLIERLLAARSVALRERVMRQKLGRTLARLEESARRLAAERTARLAAVHARNRALSELASRVAARRPTLSAAIASVLEQRIAALWPPSLPQLAPMAAGARRLLEGQARAGLSEPMVTAALAAAGVPPELRAELEPVLNVRFGGLVAALAPALAKTSLGEVALAGFGHTPSIAHASELAVDELLLSLKAMQAPIPDGAPTRTPTEQRLEALQAALAAAMA